LPQSITLCASKNPPPALPDPDDECQAYLPYGQECVLIQAIDVEQATGLFAKRYAPERYQESTTA